MKQTLRNTNGAGDTVPKWATSSSKSDDPKGKKKKRKRKKLVPKRAKTAYKTWRKVDGALQENILAALCFDTEACPIIIAAVDTALFDSHVYRNIADRSIKYYQKYGEVAGDHLPDLLEDRLNSKKRSEVRMYSEALHDLHSISKSINSKYILDELGRFVKQQSLRQMITFAAEELQRGDADATERILSEGLLGFGASNSKGVGVLNSILPWESFKTQEYPPVEDAMGIILPIPGILQISAYRGDGKTWFLLFILVGLACGVGVFGWACRRAYKVLIIDGELPPWVLQERLKAVMKALGVKPKAGMLNVYSSFSQDAGTPINLVDPSQVDGMFKGCLDYEVVGFDNFSSLSFGADQNSSETYEPFNQLCMRLRGEGLSVIRVTHLGKDKKRGARGSSRQEDPLDVALTLERQSSGLFHEAKPIRVTCNKMRHHSLSDFKPIDLEFTKDRKGRFTIKHDKAFASKAEALVPVIVELMRSGEWKKTAKALFAEQHGVERTTVHRAGKLAKEELIQGGLIDG